IRIVVELNGEIISKSQYNQINIKDGDSLEVVSFVGGG
ncbi:sulfur carrier protein ThiS, partial [Clostridium beijerinckii]